MERLNDLLKVSPKLRVGGSLKSQHDPIHLLSTHMAAVGVWLLLCNVSELCAEPSAHTGVLTLSFLFRRGMTG